MLNESFRYRDGALWCDDMPLSAIADAAGTPVYVYSAARVRHNVQRLLAAFAPLQPEVHYSVKANGNLALLRLLHAMGLGMDTVSAGEIYRAQRAGVDPARMVFAGVGKTRDELAYALEAGVGWFNVESAAELRLIDGLARDRHRIARVALRLNPGIQAQTHRHLATGHFGAKFGMSPDVVADVLSRQGDFPHVTIQGIHTHIGSQLGNARDLADAARAAQALAAPYPDLRALNIGGGYPVRYTAADPQLDLNTFAAALIPVLNGWQVMIEPGRLLVADAGVLLIETLYVKQQGAQRFVITDGSMTDLLRPALYDAAHPILPLRQREGGRETIVAGPVCESADVLSRGALLPDLEPGDRLAVLITGAYGMVMASNYNMRARPPEALVEGSTWRLVRRRETWDDLLRYEQGY